MEPTEDAKEPTANDLGSLLDAEEGAMVTLVAGDTRLEAHRAVLAARSPVFAARFDHDTQHSSSQILIPDLEGPALRQLLAYMYTLKVPQLPSVALQLLAAADKHSLAVLKARCERQVIAKLDVGTAAAAAVLAVRHSCDNLRQAAVNFIKAHTHQVMATQGWADAVRTEPEDLVEVCRLLSELPTEASRRSVSELSTAAPSEEVKEATATDLGSLLDSGDGAVVTLVAGDTRLVAHRAVLVARSPAFAARFGRDVLETGSGQVMITDIEGPVLRVLLTHLYTLQAPQLPSVAPQLLAVADKYGLSVLKAQCEEQVAAQLSVETAAAVAVLAVRHSCDNLRQAAVNFIKAHTHQVMATQGWADAVRTQPEDVVEVSRLLSELPIEASAPAPAGSATVTTTTQPHSKHSLTPVSAAPPTAARDTPPPEDAAVSGMCAPAIADSGTISATPPHSDSLASTSAALQTPPRDSAAVADLWTLSGKEKGRRLIAAAKEGAAGVVQALLEGDADVSVTDWTRWTALHHAAAMGHVEVVGCLLMAGLEVDPRDIYQETPLHCAARHGHAAVVRLLVASSADPNTKDVNERTPLHLAAYYGHAEVAKALMEAGADKQAKDEDGRTPLDIVRQYNRQQLLDILR